MMATANGICSKRLASGSVVLMARIVDGDGMAIRRSEVIAVEYSLYEVDACWPEQLTAVRGGRAVPLAVGDVLFDSPQIGHFWSVDEVGYNFRHEVDFGWDQPLAKTGWCYEVVYQLTMTTGQTANVRFRIGRK